MSSGDEAAPAPGTEEKLAQRERDDGRPARRSWQSLKDQRGYRATPFTAQQAVLRPAVPYEVSICPGAERTYWRRVTYSPSIEFEFVRREPEAPPRGTQWEEEA